MGQNMKTAAFVDETLNSLSSKEAHELTVDPRWLFLNDSQMCYWLKAPNSD